MVQRPRRFNAFEFAVLAGLRAAQLARGCTPRVTCAEKVTVTAQMEIAEGKIVRDRTPDQPREARSVAEEDAQKRIVDGQIGVELDESELANLVRTSAGESLAQ